MSLLRVEAISIRRGARLVLRDFSFEADAGEVVALVGPSGGGKTSVLRAIAGLDPLHAGSIRIGEVVLEPHTRLHGRLARDIHRVAGMVFQFHHLFSNMNVLDNVTLAPTHVLGIAREEARRTALSLLESLGIADRASARPHELSGGEGQRVAIARALAVDPPLLLMDEPTASLDPQRRGELAATLTRLARSGRALLVATHDEEFVRACVQRVVTVRPAPGGLAT